MQGSLRNFVDDMYPFDTSRHHCEIKSHDCSNPQLRVKKVNHSNILGSTEVPMLFTMFQCHRLIGSEDEDF